jgi:tetratricopeptide (TPR) repeat protein
MIGWTALHFAESGDVESARRWLNWAREEISAGSADDPLAGAPFALLWPKGKQSATADEVRLAAATLMYRRPFSARGIEILTQMRGKVTGDAQLYVDSALVTAYSAMKEAAKAEPIAKRLVDAKPDSESAVETYTSILSQLDRNAEVVKIANARLAKLPKDRTALRMLARAALVGGDYAKCDEYYRQIINEATPEAGDYNNEAWNALFLHRNLDRALEDARRASSLSPSPAVLHTLAALYAETGKSLEARDALLRSMDEAGREEPASHDWYVLGRIAENYGARDAAIAAYKRVQQTKDTGSDSTYVLAKRRMEAMR